MAFEYECEIENRKAPKNGRTIKTIVLAILDGVRRGCETKELAEELNARGIKTIMKKSWNYYSLQMQLLKLGRRESESSLVWALYALFREGRATRDDFDLLAHRAA